MSIMIKENCNTPSPRPVMPEAMAVEEVTLVESIFIEDGMPDKDPLEAKVFGSVNSSQSSSTLVSSTERAADWERSKIMDVAAIAWQGRVEVRVNGEMRVAAVVAREDFLRTCHTLMVVAGVGPGTGIDCLPVPIQLITSSLWWKNNTDSLCCLQDMVFYNLGNQYTITVPFPISAVSSFIMQWVANGWMCISL
ncbi:hypothetical protein BDN72DRAFT_866208 [Pluteus cervinus]|uniref:Uncharacterized protein n=1 Tax=Pluteus cervinus TaxID=181527 RepID=A0ACD2ZXM8_9AGAR|nr:hypothetical protein BDN72DRAFT_866208 [Pluteus cervinus]